MYVSLYTGVSTKVHVYDQPLPKSCFGGKFRSFDLWVASAEYGPITLLHQHLGSAAPPSVSFKRIRMGILQQYQASCREQLSYAADAVTQCVLI